MNKLFPLSLIAGMLAAQTVANVEPEYNVVKPVPVVLVAKQVPMPVTRTATIENVFGHMLKLIYDDQKVKELAGVACIRTDGSIQPMNALIGKRVQVAKVGAEVEIFFEGKSVNQRIFEEGLSAVSETDDCKAHPTFVASQQQAVTGKAGLWAKPVVTSGSYGLESAHSSYGSVSVKGYTRKDGTYVRGYTRRR